jgi:predicted phage tail protein
MIAIPAAGIFAGLRLAHNPGFAGGKSALVDPIVAAGFFLLAAFFTGIQWFGLLATIWIAAFLLLAIFLFGAWLIGSLVIAMLRRGRDDERVNYSTGGQQVYPLPLHQPPDEVAAAADGPLEAFLRS